jgi:hypothetical protein
MNYYYYDLPVPVGIGLLGVELQQIPIEMKSKLSVSEYAKRRKKGRGYLGLECLFLILFY